MTQLTMFPSALSEFVGNVCILYATFRVLTAFYDYFLRRPVDLNVYRREGSYAVITGASDGIGKAYAYFLASKNFNLFLVSRTESKLRAIQSDLNEKYPNIKVNTLPIDLTTNNAANSVVNAVSSLPVTLLVNNVGMLPSIPDKLVNQRYEEVSATMQLNVVFTTELTRQMLPILTRESGNQARTAIVNLSSLTAFTVSPYLSVYAASKAYNDQFSRSLAAEMYDSKVDILSVTPGYVATSMSGFKRKSFIVNSPDEIAEKSFKFLGKRTSCATSFVHSVMLNVLRMVPEVIIGPGMSSYMEKVKKKVLKRSKKQF